MLVDIVLVLDELVPHRLLQIGALAAGLGQVVDDVLHEMEAVEFVLHAHVEGGGDRAFLLVAAHVKIAVRPSVGQAMDQRGIAVGAVKPRCARSSNNF